MSPLIYRIPRNGRLGVRQALSRNVKRPCWLVCETGSVPPSLTNVDVVILGAGAAGLFCAFEAGRRGRRVLLLDHGDRPGRKILISGGGRCNFTNTGTRAENFLSENPHFARSALARFTPAEMVALVEKHGVRYHVKTLGQLFCDDSAHRVVALLERECGEAGVEIRCGGRVDRIRAQSCGPEAGEAKPRARFRLETSLGTLTCNSLVIATGGLSIPKMGATGLGYDIARQFGHRIVETRPALVPFTFAPGDLADWSDLAGISVEVVAQAELPPAKTERVRKTGAPAFREKLLLTHRGLSGPAVLQVSSYWRPGTPVHFDLAPGRRLFAEMKQRSAGRDRGALLQALNGSLPSRLTERWVDLQLRGKPDWSNAGLDRAEAALHRWSLQPAGTEGFTKAEVTAGGVDTRELDARSMESLRTPGLYFIGEVVDVTGWLGGYNFQWAWASAAACGRSL